MATATRITGELTDLSAAQPNTDVIKSATSNLAPGQYSDKISTTMVDLVKGRKDASDDQALLAERMFRNAIDKGTTAPAEVAKGLSPQFSNALTAAFQSPQAMAMQRYTEELTTQLEAALGKNITLTSPLSSGLVPYDLSAPAKQIYPVHSPFRNRLPRTQGQGTQHLGKIITAIPGSNPGGLGGQPRVSIPEMGTAGGNLSQWPMAMPASPGNATMTDIAIPYKFFGLTESVSWLAQFAGQGFQDAAGLASLILLQESMLAEERALIGATSVALGAPAAPGAVGRTANSGEVGITGASTNVYVAVTALNYYGETAASAITTPSPAVTSGVLDVTISPVPGALAYNIYVATGASAPAIGTFKLMASAVGATKYTLQGALPTSGANPPASDTGTSNGNDYEGMVSIISGHASPSVYPSGFKGSYVNQSVNDTLNINSFNTCLQAMWSGANGIFADPDELWAEGTDLARFGASVAANSGNQAGYRLEIEQGSVNGVTAGAAVSQFVNPITRKLISLNVHPYLPQGTALPISWKLPVPQSNVSNVWEVVNVQDYLSISWPVIDLSFRYSLFWYGSLFCPAVQYNGLMQGIQKSVATANSGTNS